jgi:hypothetical protein
LKWTENPNYLHVNYTVFICQYACNCFASVEVDNWDYLESSTVLNELTTGFTEYLQHKAPHYIGHEYVKARYVEYTNATFLARKPISKDWEHLLMLGPVVRGVVGDNITIVLKNRASRSYSIVPHALNPWNGTIWSDTTAVSPGATRNISWHIPPLAGPADEDGSSIVWGYHSNVNEPADIYSGLVGPIIVARPSSIRDHAHAISGIPNDVDREFVAYFAVIDENQSHYLAESMNAMGVTASVDNSSFVLSNVKRAING